MSVYAAEPIGVSQSRFIASHIAQRLIKPLCIYNSDFRLRFFYRRNISFASSNSYINSCHNRHIASQLHSTSCEVSTATAEVDCEVIGQQFDESGVAFNSI